MGLFFKKLRVYSALQEMRLFWLLLPIVVIISVLSVIYLPASLRFSGIALFVLLLLIVLLNNLRLARSNLEIKVERNELTSIINNLRDGIIAYDTDFKVLIFNQAAEMIFDIPADEVVGKKFFPDAGKNPGFNSLVQVMFPSLATYAISRSEPEASIQILDLSFENPRLELRVSSTKIIDPSKKVLGFLKVVTDRTREADLIKAKADFITVAAHQLRTPLNAVSWTFETLEKETGLSDEGKTFVSNGREVAAKMLGIVNNLLDIAKMEEGRFGYSFEEVDLISLFDEILREAAAFASKYGVNIYFEKPDVPALTVTADKAKIAMAVNNLIDNAIKYNVKNGKVTLRLAQLADKPYVEISVIDTGLGMAPEDLKKIFTKFFRAENAVKAETEGSGLGLYLAKNVIMRHGGEISAESEINRGTTITFTLPTDPRLIPPKEIVYE